LDRRYTLALLYVHPAYRHRGIGSGLLHAAEGWLYYIWRHWECSSSPLKSAIHL